MKGIIVRVHLKQFMVFTDIEVRPGRNVNIVIAPNGSGKSSLIAGIMLGLCGKPHDTGRGTSIGTYVKTGFREAFIEIELLNPGENYIIQRHIYQENNKSLWLLNGSRVTQKQVEEVMAKLHIQVDNLCQVLPQDRVYEFSRMNPETLLENTEKSVGPELLMKYHNKLKEMSKTRGDMTKKRKDFTTRLERMVSTNRGLRGTVEVMLKKAHFMEKINLLKHQRAWVMYKEEYTKVQQLKESLIENKNNLAEHKKREAQITSGMGKLRSKVIQLTALTKQKNDEKQQVESKLSAAIAGIDRQQDSLETIEQAFEKAKASEVVRLKELEQLRQHLSKLECDLANYSSVSDEETKEKINKITANITDINRRLTGIQHEEEILQDKIQNIKHNIRAEAEKKRRYEDKSNQRLNTVRKILPDVHEAIMWLRQNKNEFTHKIYEPIMLEIDVKDDAYIQYLEEAIPKRDLQAFTCENKEDMNKFISIVREQLKLSVNVLYSGPEHHPSSSYHPKFSMEELRNYGFNMFVKDMFTAPEIIMKYLCRTAGVYRIPVGSSKVDEIFESLPPSVSFFFSATNKYFVRVSKYSREKCVQINGIQAPRLLSSGVDQSEVIRINESIKKLSEEKAKFDTEMMALREKHNEHEGRLSDMKDERRKLQASIGGKDLTERRIRAKREQIASVEVERVDIAEERRKSNVERIAVMTNLCGIDGKIKVLAQKLDTCVKDYVGTRWQLNDTKDRLKRRENDARSTMEACAEQVEIVRRNEQQYVRTRDEAKVLHTDALAFTNGVKPGTDFYNLIVDSREVLSRKIQELQAKADFMSDANDKVIKEYEAREKEISHLTEDINNIEDQLKSLSTKVTETREMWLPQLKEFIEKINTNFGRYFARLGCAGEVVLGNEDPDDYETYGINIKVKFRDGDKLQDLNQYTQSGGERSVATALYMIAMQELTHVPFRCVDEINQGMDPINERRVFELLANATEGDNTPQYFLLTPKLLPDLRYNQQMTVTCIINGTVQQMECWNVNNHIQLRKKCGNKTKNKVVNRNEEDRT